MADPHGFLTVPRRETPERRPVPIRLLDYREVYEAGDPDQPRRQASRRMDCGVPFCHQGRPAGQPHPGVQRCDVPRGAAARRRPPPRDEQLPPNSPAGRVRRRVRTRACSASTSPL